MAVHLILVRHAKSDWDAGLPDRQRPLNARGARQAPATGEWIAEQFDELDLAVVSVAARARLTWEKVAAHLDPVPEVVWSEDAYTFDGDDLADLVAELPRDASTVVLVGHNPALEELIDVATGSSVTMPTSAVAVLRLASWGEVASGGGVVEVAGRPADGRWEVG